MSVRRALVFSFLDRNASLVIGIVSSMVLARLLTPADIGVFSVVMVLLSFVTAWRDFGAGQYLVQEAELTPDRIRAVWTLQLGIGLGMALLTLAASWPVALFYDEPRMRGIMALLALSYLVNPFGSLTYAWLMRTMRFEALTVMRFSATLAGAVVGVMCAWWGLGAISLAWGSLASIVVNALVSLAFRPPDFPLLPGTREIGRVLRFGTRLTTTSMMETAAQGAPELVLGKLQGMTSVGLYSRGNGLIALFARLVTDSVNAVAMPLFAQQKREGGDLGAAFLRGNAYVTVIGWSFALGVALLAQPLIRVLYGPQWEGSVEITRWLALFMALSLPAALCFQVLVGSGASERLPPTMAKAAGATVLAAAAGAWFGVLPMVWGLIVAAGFSTTLWLWTTRQVLGFALPTFLAGLLKSAAVALLSALPPLATMLWLGWSPAQPLLALALGGVGAAIAGVAGLLLLDHPLARELRPLMDKLRRRG